MMGGSFVRRCERCGISWAEVLPEEQFVQLMGVVLCSYCLMRKMNTEMSPMPMPREIFDYNTGI